jgi:hypothetical protein
MKGWVVHGRRYNRFGHTNEVTIKGHNVAYAVSGIYVITGTEEPLYFVYRKHMFAMKQP